MLRTSLGLMFLGVLIVSLAFWGCGGDNSPMNPSGDTRAKGGKSPGEGPTGQIFYVDYEEGGPFHYVMDANGDNRTPYVGGVPSFAEHGGKRWMLQVREVAGTYPNGDPRRELFAVRADGASSVQLTDNREICKPDDSGDITWGTDRGLADGKVAFSGGPWVQNDAGEWEIDRSIYGVPVTYGADGGPLGPAPSYLVGETEGGRHPSWSPDGARLVFGSEAGLYLSDGSGCTLLVEEGSGPDWAPNGAMISFSGEIIAPDGTEREVVVPEEHRGNSSVTWCCSRFSPDSRYLTLRKTKASFRPLKFDCDVYRVKLDGSDLRKLTQSRHAQPIAWR